MPKDNFRQTSKKDYKKQLAHIEHQKAQINYIRQRIATAQSEPVAAPAPGLPANDLAQHYCIGISENHPQHIGTFHQAYAGDPAVKVSGYAFPSFLPPCFSDCTRILFQSLKSIYCASSKKISSLMLQPAHKQTPKATLPNPSLRSSPYTSRVT